jgi:hypothetical protein
MLKHGHFSLVKINFFLKKRDFVAGLPQRRPRFDPESVHVGFGVDKVALGQVFPKYFGFFPVSFIPLVLHYMEKRKNSSSSFSSPSTQGCTISLNAAVGP